VTYPDSHGIHASPSPTVAEGTTMIRRNRALWPLLLASLLTLSLPTLAGARAETLTLLTHDSFAVSKEVLQGFTDATGITVRVLQAGDAGAVVNRAVLTRNRPIADVLYGIDNSLLPRARRADLFEPYLSPRLSSVDPRYRFDPEHLVTPVDVGWITLNVDRAALARLGVPAPTDLAQLTEPRYRGMLAVEDPATSSPGLAFLLMSIARFGEGGEGDWLDFWAGLRNNDVAVSQGWNDAYYTAFSRYGGDRPIVVSYNSSPAAEVVFADSPLQDSPTANVSCPGCAYRQIEAAGILRGTSHRRAAEAFIDFLLSPSFQGDMPLTMFVYPVVAGAPTPEVFQRYAPVPDAVQTASVDDATLDAAQQRWLRQWTAVVRQGRAPASVR